MLARRLIERKRDGLRIDSGEWRALALAYAAGHVPDYQMAALMMACFLNGLDRGETSALTDAMLASGSTLDLAHLPVQRIDKHSTGGVGDKVSLVLAPLVASLGVAVPMMSGRGLGHTGGTLDKLDAIPGFRTALTLAEARAQIERIGCALIGQTAEIAPADRKLYALRDATATVESIALISASIMSKKLAEGLTGLVLDVKRGSGAFMGDEGSARVLAESLVLVANGAGLRTSALLTDMHEPLASAAGNAVEVAYVVDYLTGRRREPRFHAVTVALGAEMLQLGGLAADEAEASRRIEDAVASGRAAEIFGRMVAALGGPTTILERAADHLTAAPIRRAVHAEEGGHVDAIATRDLGLAVVALGGGRTHPHGEVDHAVGLVNLAAIGERVDGTLPLGVVHARTEGEADAAAAALRRAYRIAPTPTRSGPLVLERIGAPA